MRRNYRVLLRLLSALFITLTGYYANAQKAFEKSHALINGGIVIYDGSVPVTISAEYGITDQIGAGLKGYYTGTSNGYDILNASAFANYHFGRSAKLDPFAGLALEKSFYPNDTRGVISSNTVLLDAQAGIRCLFTGRLGAYGQAIVPFSRGPGLGVEVGLTLKL